MLLFLLRKVEFPQGGPTAPITEEELPPVSPKDESSGASSSDSDDDDDDDDEEEEGGDAETIDSPLSAGTGGRF